jgi:SAM-dependent methyltransferase
MKNSVSTIVVSCLTLAVVANQIAFAQNIDKTTEAKMFAVSAGYERFMGRWSRLLAPAYITFAGVRNGDDVLDVGSGTGSLAATVEEGMPASEVVGVDPSEGFIAYAQKNAKSPRVRFEVGDAQALKFKDASFDNTLALLVMNFVPDENKAVAEMRRVTRAQGTVSACVWDYDAGMQMLRFFWDEAVALDPAIEPKDERHCEAISPGTAGRSLEEGWTNQHQGGAAGDRPSVFIIQRLLGAIYEWCGPRGSLRCVAFPRSPRTARISYAQAIAWRSPGWSIHT